MVCHFREVVFLMEREDDEELKEEAVSPGPIDNSQLRGESTKFDLC